MDFLDYLHKTKIVGLSPMDGVTDEPFRLTLAHYSRPDVFFTEFVSAEGLAHNGIKLFDHLMFKESEVPIVGQLFGKDPTSFYAAAVILCHLGFQGIDINMGCPAHTVTQHGSGAALIAKPDLAAEIIKAVKNGIDDYHLGRTNPKKLRLKEKTLKTIDKLRAYSGVDKLETLPRPTLSVKTRLGIHESTIDQWVPHLLTLPINFLTLHGRTLKQGYSGTANWDDIAHAKKLSTDSNVLLFGNGDVPNRLAAAPFFEKYQVDGILIGRSTMGNPWAFLDYAYTPTVEDRFRAMFYHSQVFLELFPTRRFEILRRHYISYVTGLAGATELRMRLVRVNSLKDLEDLEQEILSRAGN
jgi:tRNA-dihydrouridine synthase